MWQHHCPPKRATWAWSSPQNWSQASLGAAWGAQDAGPAPGMAQPAGHQDQGFAYKLQRSRAGQPAAMCMYLLLGVDPRLRWGGSACECVCRPSGEALNNCESLQWVYELPGPRRS